MKYSKNQYINYRGGKPYYKYQIILIKEIFEWNETELIYLLGKESKSEVLLWDDQPIGNFDYLLAEYNKDEECINHLFCNIEDISPL
jgi:hypothetical protein